jgi:lauroyl/myristoyl acyltransferase
MPIPPITRARIGLVRAFLMLWVRCFSLSGLYVLGRFFGTLEYIIDYRRRGRVHRKLASMFKDEFDLPWRRRMARRYFMRIRCDKMFYTIMDRIPRNKLMNRIKPRGRKYVDAALAQNRGVYIALCHFGSFHVAGLLGALLGYELVGVRDPKESPVRRYIGKKYRESFPEVARMKLFYSGQFPREIYRNLKDGKIVASLLDVDRIRGEHLKTCPVRFFGETREFLTGPVQMAIRCGATVVQAFVVSRRDFYYQLSSTPPLYQPADGADEETVLPKVMQRYADGVEQFAREHPDHLMNI